MATWALIVDGKVWETTDVDPKDRFDASFVWASCPSSVSVGWVYDGKAFTAPVVPPVDLVAYLADKRFAIETGGVVINDVLIATDRASQSLITGAYNYVQANPEVTVKFKTAAGFVELTAAQMIAVANAVGAHVQASFAVEAVVSAAIASGSITTTAAIDAASWPEGS